MKNKLLLALLAAGGLTFQVSAEEKQPQQPVVSKAQTLQTVRFDISKPMRLMTPKPIVAQAKRGGLMVDPGSVVVKQRTETLDIKDPVVQDRIPYHKIPAPLVSFDAINNVAGATPPDPVGDVGPNHYVVMSNVNYAILDKSGNTLYGPATNNTIWSGFGGECEAQNAGDPIVLYDQIADRWLLTQFTSSGSTYYNCVALSTSGDPTGSYYRWAISNGSLFPDYPKYGVWGDGYYISTRDFSSGSYVGIGAYALSRADMVSGNPNPTVIYFSVSRSTDPWRVGDGLLPADLDGDTLPPTGSPQYFVGTMDDGYGYGASDDALSIWKFVADFNTPANSSFSLANTVSSAAFDTVFPCSSGRNCIPQQGTTNQIDIQSYRQRPLHRLAYRNFGTHESLVTNQSVEAATGIAGIRWWEIRSPGSSPSIYQQGTYAPGVTDGIHRWMGSAAMDKEGNIGLGYSASSDSMYPAIRYTGRLVSSPLGVMDQGEQSIVEGTGSQTGSQRWGDYTSLNIDSTDDCTFWYVNEYLSTNGTGWKLRVGSFKFDECGTPGFYLSSNQSTQNICSGQSAQFDVHVGSISNYNGAVSLVASGNPSPTTAAFSVNPISSLPGDTVLTIGNTAGLPSSSYSLQIQGSASGADNKTLDLTLNAYQAIPTALSLTAPADGATSVDFQPSLNWSATDGQTYQVEIAADSAFSNIVFSGTTGSTSYVPQVTLDSATTYYWRVKATNPCGDSAYSATFSFTTKAAPGDCGTGYGPQVAYQYGFESGLGGWSAASNTSGGPDTWAETTTIVHSGSTAVNGEDVTQTGDQTFTSPSITVPSGLSSLTLQFWNKQILESSSSGCWDGGVLEVSTDGGSNFTQVANDKLLTDSYDGEFGSGNPLSGQQGWCGDPQDWLKSVVDISDYAGQDVQFRFRLVTDGSVGREGWTIDDVKVQGCEVTVDLIFKDGFEGTNP